MRFPLPDLSGNRYASSPQRRAAALARPLSGVSFLMNLRYAFLVVWSGIKFVFARDPQAAVTLQAKRVMRILERRGADFLVEGLGNFPREDGPYVFACNHMSTLEVNALPGLIASKVPMTFVVKEGLLRTPFFGRVLKRLRAIPVTRRHPGEDLMRVLDHGARLLKDGVSVILFPEGTRQEVFRPARFNSLAVKLAAANGVKVVPVALRTDFWEVGRLIKDFGPIRRDNPVRIAFGEPLAPEGRGKAEHRKVVDFIVSRLEEWGVPVEAAE